MKLFTKNDQSEYNDKLEDILETKKINSETKSLLLSMLYKIENAYQDYYMVKIGTEEKEEYIKRLLNIIKNNCEEIITVTPKTPESEILEKQGKSYIVNVEKGEILSYANEKDLLNAIFRLNTEYLQYNSNKEYNSKSNKKLEDTCKFKATQIFLEKGTAMNQSEVIRDFNGWSWNTDVKSMENITINLIYQNIFLLLGEKIRKEVLEGNYKKGNIEVSSNELKTNAKDLREYNDMDLKSSEIPEEIILKYNNIIYKAFNTVYLNDRIEKIVDYINIIILAIEANEDDGLENDIKYIIESRRKKLELMKDKQLFLDKIIKDKRTLSNRIKQIDKILNDRDQLAKEYETRNMKLSDEYKIFSISHLARILENERKELLNQIDNKNRLQKPEFYIMEKAKLEKSLEYYKEVIKAMGKGKSSELIIKIQKEFLKCFMIQVEQADSKTELTNLFYKFRYYCLLPINEIQEIKDIPALQDNIKEIMDLLIDKCIDNKIIENISNSVSLCYNTLKYVFFSRIVDLEHIYIKIESNKEEIVNVDDKKEKNYHITISLFDIKEEEEKYDTIVNNLSLLNIKLKKKTQLFL